MALAPRPPVNRAVRAAVHRHDHLSKQGLLERAFTFAFRGLVYAQIWEDPAVDMAALAITPDCHVVTIASGAAKFDFWVFMLSSLVTRGGRFFLETTLLHFRKRHPILVSVLAVAIVLGMVLALKLL